MSAPRPAAALPAPIWRRCAAALYDGLLLLALWMVVLLIDTVVRDLIALPREWHAMRALLFLVGLAFFGWFWTHGGQTLGMRAWRLQLRRTDGSPVSWLVAAVRYAAMLLSWGIALTPLLLRLPTLAARPASSTIAASALLLLVLGLVWARLDPQRRAPCDRFSGTEVVLLPS